MSGGPYTEADILWKAEEMVRFDEHDRLARALQRLCIGKVHFKDGFSWAEQFKAENRALIVANHGPIIGPAVWAMAVFPRIVDLGYGHLTYSAIAHPMIRNIPLFARMVGYEKRKGQRLRAADYIELFKSGRLNIVSVAPEGEFSVYGNGVDIQPFRSPRSLEIALEAGCRIILLVGQGFEKWQRNISIEAGWRKQLVRFLALRIPFLDKVDEAALGRARQLSVSGLFGRIPDFYVASEIYEPELTAAALARDREVRDEQLWREAGRMRRQMVRMLEDLRADDGSTCGPRPAPAPSAT